MIEKLREAGLTEYESRVYLSLLEKGPLLGGEVCRHSGVPHPKTYEALNSLEEKGFVVVTPIKPKVFSAVEPKAAVGSLISSKIESFKKLGLELGRGLVARKRDEGEKGFYEKVKILAGEKSQFNLSSYFYSTARREVSQVFTYEYLYPAHNRDIRDAVKRGVKVRIIGTSISKEGLTMMKQHIRLGAEVRFYRIDELRMQVKDDREARITLYNPKNKGQRITAYFEHGELSKVLSSYLGRVWSKAKVVTLSSKLSDFG
ncbi:MAG: TrmB family transcriptional regulator [Candidatus Diapherotrites archaeon]|uniref:TrmB family transcriptional regulator n=1 Tax=Candidatus Iainarchaeum sp. TaxID=3101447 RepID=A0A8T3YJT4_9ARCH|nr:TrmB family transcriptional regulator [Candidatus Diapherotrites archaeon]